MSIRPMMYHIFNPDHEPLCWDGQALEFETRESAERFLAVSMSECRHDTSFYNDAIIKEGILYYDGGYLDATNLIPVGQEKMNDQGFWEIDEVLAPVDN